MYSKLGTPQVPQQNQKVDEWNQFFRQSQIPSQSGQQIQKHSDTQYDGNVLQGRRGYEPESQSTQMSYNDANIGGQSAGYDSISRANDLLRSLHSGNQKSSNVYQPSSMSNMGGSNHLDDRRSDYMYNARKIIS
jgi:hypothetical protein